MKNILLAIPVVAMLFSSCRREELPVPRKDRGPVKTVAIEMEGDYRWQVYYDLQTQTVVGKNLKTDWDLAFATGNSDYAVLLNSANYMLAYNTGKTDFTAVTIKDTTGKMRWDNPGGYLDSTAIGDWRGKNEVYILDRGYDLEGSPLGFMKIVFTSVDDNKYIVRFADIKGDNETTVEIKKDSLYNSAFLSFDKKAQVMVQPPKKDWDLVFTQYVHVYVDINTPYRVTGCLLNNGVEAAVDKQKAFAEINVNDMGSYTLSKAVNTIGFEWKAFNNTTYVTNPNINYILRDGDGLYYKLHFIDFLNDKGTKGYPKFEYQQL